MRSVRLFNVAYGYHDLIIGDIQNEYVLTIGVSDIQFSNINSVRSNNGVSGKITASDKNGSYVVYLINRDGEIALVTRNNDGRYIDIDKTEN